MDIGKKIFKGFREIPVELQRFLNRNYPVFVTDKDPVPSSLEVPVFMFHMVEEHTFQKQLEFLEYNGYKTLTLEAFISFLEGKTHLRDPSVLLTFDDGHRSWYDVAYPLLRRYNFNAVGFVVPFYLKKKHGHGSTEYWLSWSEVIDMEKSGVFEIESHTYYHDRIFNSPRLVDFFHPRFSHNQLGIDVPWLIDNGFYTNRLKWGTPIYSYGSRFEDRARYIDNREVREACIKWVESQGGELFFQRQGWRRRLKKYYQTVSKKNSTNQYETVWEQRERIHENLQKAKDILEAKLNKKVRHLCYPWGCGSRLSVSISQEVGYISNFWGTLSNRRSNKKGETPFYITRLKDDYIFRLPGRGRKSLYDIFKMKLQRRAQNVNLY